MESFADLDDLLAAVQERLLDEELALGLVAAGNELMIAWHDDEQISRAEAVDFVMVLFDALAAHLAHR